MAGVDKLFTEVSGRPLLAHTIAAFEGCPAVHAVVLVLSEANLERGRELVKREGFAKVTSVVIGGGRRQDSVRCGLEALGRCDLVAVHDGARPLVTPELIERGVEAARETGAAVPGVPLADTVKEAGTDGVVVRTLDRSRLWAIQTPQVFRHDPLLRAHREVTWDVTDDAAMVEALGVPVLVFEGERRNLKVTTVEDIDYVNAVMSNVDMQAPADFDRGDGPERCPFCEYTDSASIVYEDDNIFAVVDRQPINKYHLLVIPRLHYTSLGAIPDDLIAQVMLLVKRLSSAVRAVARPDAITHYSDDDLAGLGLNLVEHFKFHVIPRYRDDDVKLEWNRGPVPESQLRAKIAREVRRELADRKMPRTAP
jgi:2-C-methyl-D-erythritol 4-phosphate cytidylyltransferase